MRMLRERKGLVSFNVEVKTNGHTLHRGDLFYEKRKLYRVERVGQPRGKSKRFSVRFRLIGAINFDQQLREDRAL